MGNRVLAILVIICGYSYKTAFFSYACRQKLSMQIDDLFTGIIKKQFAKY
jgi:hypothetical protein